MEELIRNSTNELTKNTHSLENQIYGKYRWRIIPSVEYKELALIRLQIEYKNRNLSMKRQIYR